MRAGRRGEEGGGGGSQTPVEQPAQRVCVMIIHSGVATLSVVTSAQLTRVSTTPWSEVKMENPRGETVAPDSDHL